MKTINEHLALKTGDDEKWLFCHELPTSPVPEKGLILVTGGSGFIGGRLIPELLYRGYRVRVMVRAYPEDYVERWPGAEIVEADALAKISLKSALDGVYCAYYLIHSLLSGTKKFQQQDIFAAKNFAEMATDCGVKRIIYLGAMGDIQQIESPHLQSRIEVARTLSRSKAMVTTLRAGIVIGSGSASYEIIHHLVKRDMFIFLPPWAGNKIQPIAIRDVIKYLVGALETEETANGEFDIGSPDILSYEDMIRIFSDVLGKKRMYLHVPFNALNFFSYVLSILTPVPVQIIQALLQGLKDEVVSRENVITELIPFQCLTYREAIVRALTREEQDEIHTRWSDAYPPAHELAIKLKELEGLHLYTSGFSIKTRHSAYQLFDVLTRLGGKKGWFHLNILWEIRGIMDRFLFGIGSQRGRKMQKRLMVNDVIGFWRVEEIKLNRKLLLRAEMKLPGMGWLEFAIDDHDDERRLTATLYFYPHTFWGKLYWAFFYPFHYFIFRGMLRNITGEIRSSNPK